MQTTASSEKKYAPPKRSEKQIGNTTFIVNSFFREKSDESIAVKLECLMKADVQKEGHRDCRCFDGRGYAKDGGRGGTESGEENFDSC